MVTVGRYSKNGSVTLGERHIVKETNVYTAESKGRDKICQRPLAADEKKDVRITSAVSKPRVCDGHWLYLGHSHLLTKLAMSGSLFIGSLLHSSNSNIIASNSSSLLSVVAAIMVGPQTTSCRRMERTEMDSAAGSIATGVPPRASDVSDGRRLGPIIQRRVSFTVHTDGGGHWTAAGLDADMIRDAGAVINDTVRSPRAS